MDNNNNNGAGFRVGDTTKSSTYYIFVYALQEVNRPLVDAIIVLSSVKMENPAQCHTKYILNILYVHFLIFAPSTTKPNVLL